MLRRILLIICLLGMLVGLTSTNALCEEVKVVAEFGNWEIISLKDEMCDNVSYYIASRSTKYQTPIWIDVLSSIPKTNNSYVATLMTNGTESSCLVKSDQIDFRVDKKKAVSYTKHENVKSNTIMFEILNPSINEMKVGNEFSVKVFCHTSYSTYTFNLSGFTEALQNLEKLECVKYK